MKRHSSPTNPHTHTSSFHLHIRPDGDWNVISLFSWETCTSAVWSFEPPLRAIPSVLVFPISFTSDASSHQFVVGKSPSCNQRIKKTFFFSFPHPILFRWQRVRRHYALAHFSQRECLWVAVFNQTPDGLWDDCGRQITSPTFNRARFSSIGFQTPIWELSRARRRKKRERIEELSNYGEIRWLVCSPVDLCAVHPLIDNATPASPQPLQCLIYIRPAALSLTISSHLLCIYLADIDKCLRWP